VGNPWQYREKEHRLRGESTNRELRLGDHVLVEVKSIGEDRHQIEFRLLELAGSPVATRQQR
jgi:exoribonuclease R